MNGTILYGRTEQPAAAAPTAAPNQAAADKLYDRPSPTASGSSLHDDALLVRQALAQRAEDRAVVAGLSDKGEREYVDAHTRAIVDAGLGGEAVGPMIVAAYDSAFISRARHGEDATLPEHLQALQEASISEVRGVYGHDAGELIERTKRFVAQNPALQEMLAFGDVGSQPAIVLGLADVVRRRDFR